MRARPVPSALIGFSFLAGAVALAGCNIIGGLADLTIADSTSTGASSGSGGGGTGGTGGSTMTMSSGGGGSCSDQVMNGDETSVDCGGPACNPCAAEADCKVNSDCETGICRGRCRKVTQIAAGNAFACAVVQPGVAYCWGANAHGQLGTGDLVASPAPVEVTLPDVVEVAAGGLPDATDVGHACARTMGGSVYCWGANESGQLGTGDTKEASSPTVVSSFTGAKRVAAGGAFGCAILGNNTVSCWGANTHGELVNGNGTSSPDPVAAVDLGTATQLSLGARHGCALLGGGPLSCWGDNARFQLGNDTPDGAAKPANVAGLTTPTLPGAGADFSCALDANGLQCWGDNQDSQLSEAVGDTLTATPTKVAISGVSRFALGSDGVGSGADAIGGHACAVVAGGKVACWGNNLSGQLGRGSTSPKGATPSEVAGLDGVIDVAAGAGFSCALLATGAMRCWGRNDLGQLGTGKPGDAQSSPLPVAWP